MALGDKKGEKEPTSMTSFLSLPILPKKKGGTKVRIIIE